MQKRACISFKDVVYCQRNKTNQGYAQFSHRKRTEDIMKEKVVLAYSGGLDTTAIIPWLKENFDYEVICVCINCGQGDELDNLEERSKFFVDEKLYILDVTDEFCD